ncbi:MULTISPECIES: copper homeostasis protein CutC [unclassified Curtobacterium]|uniref:copper homeostasis protein CutC n=1 Tax=unclassified Curtobacterium TaxID=257496 RepID=UPI0008DDA3C3|nr:MULTISPECIES: copper homeostasis protein CutC [unclassified Curtobacterium]OIH99793.1 copper homeostasis protein CutC [Curtobacterium sp. MCBA15_003]OII11718.1 copper homeostasis protein CutC [Curtobacterium sp. MCBA15_009]OII30369.1 copper homeostasis protein CutC [Curtobacterium sp. MMLR14_006]
MTTAPVALEIAVTSPAGAVVARDGGADRVELCVGLELGGLTPSQALVEATHETGIPAHALVRCRPGGFVHTPDEIALMEREVRAVLRSGAAGVVVGALRADRTLDRDALRRFVDAARSVSATAEVTLHRAVDHAIDPVTAAATVADLGFTRVLTSGGAPTAAAGAVTIARMVEAAGPVQVMAGAGVTPHDVPALVRAGVAAVHLSAKRPAADSAHDGVPMGGADDGSAHFVTDAEVVAAARRALDA